MVVVHSANTEIKIELNLFGTKEGYFPDFRLPFMILAMPVNWLIGAKYSHLYILQNYYISYKYINKIMSLETFTTDDTPKKTIVFCYKKEHMRLQSLLLIKKV